MTSDRAGLRAELFRMLDDETGIRSTRSSWGRIAALGDRDDLALVFSVSEDKVSVYMKARTEAASHWVTCHADALTAALGTVMGQGSGQAAKGYLFRKDNRNACLALRRTWPEAIRFFQVQFARFDQAIRQLEDVT
ncbi:hypothetical protein [Pseudoponticoccus marisrubri]|uniref:Uncharacterized protein n=1 Tax=Pseudoponticoccus marisrubri TaxID=1685382 RepID=A0A0W7WIW4_9RHOB|nr:hypothetical protein [Pseudoponticoccus marisrubri]KUF10454.1 hypothetical protein AVJ23_11225 [Pseudoponticoccus marisrubri]